LEPKRNNKRVGQNEKRREKDNVKKIAAAAMAAAFALGANTAANAQDVQISLVDIIFDGISDSEQAYKNLLGNEEI
jgi:hypothetical protein